MTRKRNRRVPKSFVSLITNHKARTLCEPAFVRMSPATVNQFVESRQGSKWYRINDVLYFCGIRVVLKGWEDDVVICLHPKDDSVEEPDNA